MAIGYGDAENGTKDTAQKTQAGVPDVLNPPVEDFRANRFIVGHRQTGMLACSTEYCGMTYQVPCPYIGLEK